MKLNYVVLYFSLVILVSCGSEKKRAVIPLNGEWQVEEGSMNNPPDNYSHTVRVPGLVNMAEPPFVNSGPKVWDRNNIYQADTLREAFWYHRSFRINDNIPDVARLKVSKAMFGTRVYLNGKDIGEHLPCFTPGLFDIKSALKKGDNELVIRIGSSRNSIPPAIPDGFDFEKNRYIPGIFDDVELQLSGKPFIISAQAIPDIKREQVKIHAKIMGSDTGKESEIIFRVTESKSGIEAGRASVSPEPAPDSSVIYVDAIIPVKNCHLWSPEDPFLYNLIIESAGDEYSTRFGMREFYYDAEKSIPVLNGKPYYLRGSNITLYRFFEDEECGLLPWDTSWVRKLHQSFEQFHWNSLRYCIGIAPESWYRIADEVGILIQNEFPIWYGGKGWNKWPDELKRDELAKEYTEWIEEQWNHPSIIIWDASNETVSHNGKTEEIAAAIEIVRALDLSGRPWDNSYSSVRSKGDVLELHPYHFQDPKFTLKNIAEADTNPGGQNLKRSASPYMKIVNEYGWLWLNRDGSPTTLTSDLYRNLLGKKSTTEQRRETYARYLAAETEFWRCHRECAGVMHFNVLGYSRRDGQTSDHFTDVKNLDYEDNFVKYIHDAFSPVGLMLDEWGKEIQAESYHFFKINVVNDLDTQWKGQVLLEIFSRDTLLSGESRQAIVPPYEMRTLKIGIKTPELPGKYTVIASLIENKTEKPVRSVREIPFVSEK
ncbi:MAG TPA: glycoside hydrolase family 2 TIM barrel-domain containing protein [Bacteroidales bacterium]|nr:glycoside hydrolase family 2 TIM barrel-domain containing protein [Bacteroidales bacterium]